MKYFFTLIMIGICISSAFCQDIEKIKIKSPIKINGAVSANAGLSSISNGDDRTSPYSYSLNTRLSMTWNHLKMPFYFSIRDHSFNYGVTTPRFRINPKYKWAELQLGDVFMRFNRYTLSQRNMRGVGVKLNPGKFRFQAVYGQMQELNSFQDTLRLGISNQEVFSNQVMGLALGYGKRSSYFDIYLLKAWTDIDSISFTHPDLTRRDNLLVGSTAKVKILKGLYFQTNVGVSALTNDLQAIGDNTSVAANSVTGSLLEVNASTGAHYAGDVSLRYSRGVFGLNGKVSYVQAFYQPLTVAYINSDVLNYTVGSHVSLWRNKVYVNGRIGIQQNNLSDIDNFTTNRLIYSLLSNVKLHRSLTATVTYNNFSQSLTTNLVNINDKYTYAVNNRVSNISFTHQLSSDRRDITNLLSIGATNFTTANDNETNTTSYDVQYARWNGDFMIKALKLSILAGLNIQQYDSDQDINQNYGATLGLGKQFFDERLRLELRNNFNYLDQGPYREGTSLISNFATNYKVGERSTLLFNVQRMARRSVLQTDFTEYRTRISYQYRF